MKLALVTTPPEVTSTVGDYVHALRPCLEERMEVTLFHEHTIGTLNPRDHDQVLYVVGDEACCGFMARALRAIGGTVDLFAWELASMSRAAWPELEDAGVRSFLRRIREGKALNRSVIRHGDGFIVRDQGLATRILVDRNARTPIALIETEDHDEIAARYAEILESFPTPRAARRPLVFAIMAEADRRREERKS